MRPNPFTSDESRALAAADTSELLAELARRYPDADLSAITAPRDIADGAEAVRCCVLEDGSQAIFTQRRHGDGAKGTGRHK